METESLLFDLYQAVRGYFRFEADPARQEIYVKRMRDVMQKVTDKMEFGDDEDL